MGAPEQYLTGIEPDPERTADLGAALEDVVQEAVDATATAYSNDASIDVDERLATELSSRGLRADDQARAAMAADIRSGHPVDLGKSDGSTG